MAFHTQCAQVGLGPLVTAQTFCLDMIHLHCEIVGGVHPAYLACIVVPLEYLPPQKPPTWCGTRMPINGRAVRSNARAVHTRTLILACRTSIVPKVCLWPSRLAVCKNPVHRNTYSSPSRAWSPHECHQCKTIHGIKTAGYSPLGIRIRCVPRTGLNF